jgi:hypothetical protein
VAQSDHSFPDGSVVHAALALLLLPHEEQDATQRSPGDGGQHKQGIGLRQ